MNVSLTYDLWRAAQFTASELTNNVVSGPDADPDGDGVLNFTEYGLDLDPHVVSRAGLPAPAWTLDGAARYLTLVANRNAAATDVLSLVEVSSNLAQWFSGPTHLTVLEDAPARLRVRDNTPADSAPQRFLKLTLTP